MSSPFLPSGSAGPSSTVDVSVVIPTYRGAASLPVLVPRLCEELVALGISHEVVVVNDASPDETWSVLTALSEAHPQVRALELLTNAGQAQATLCGLAHARGEVVVTMDDDGQHDPASVGDLLAVLEDAPDLDAVVGSWPRDQGALRGIGTRVHGAVNAIAYESPKGFRHTAFRAIRRPVVDAMVRRGTTTPVISSLLWHTTRRIANVEVVHRDRSHGVSNFRFLDSTRTVVRNLLQASTLPLRLLSTFGIAAALLAFAVSLVYLGRWLAGAQPPAGWTSTFLLSAFFGGATLFGIGLVGEYVGLALQEVRGRQGWEIRRELDRDR
jgi:polyisoprenyl-phosphate glycosyltransferase